MKIATRSRHGKVWHVTIWRGPGRANRWQSRVSSLLTANKLKELREWLSQTVPDTSAWIVEHLPWLPTMIGDRWTSPTKPHKWVYGRLAVVRIENDGFTVALDYHGGTRHMPGSWRTEQEAIDMGRSLGATAILCAGPGQNAGNIFREEYRCMPGIHRTDKFSALLRARPLCPVNSVTETNQPVER